MSSRSFVLVIGDEPPAKALMAALAQGRVLTRHSTARQAIRSPGAFLDADLVVWAFRPGLHPALEGEAHASGAGALYVRWNAEEAEVGPFVYRGLGPCPACLAPSSTALTAGSDPLLGAWACAWAALQCSALMSRHTSELVAASWRWNLHDPALVLAGWPRRHGCPVPGCVQPRSPSTSSTPSPYRVTFD